MKTEGGKEFMAFLAMAMSAAAEDYKERLTGPQGPKGEDSTVQGPIGQVGPMGATGLMGPIGPKGDRGDTGPIGPRGLDGYGGKDGIDGKDGKDAVEFTLTDDVLTYGGFWKFGVEYRKGALVAHAGDIWYRENAGADGKPGKSNNWMLFLKSGAGRMSGYGVVQGQGGGGGTFTLPAGTSGGVLFYNSTSTVASSALLAANSVVLGGGAGNPPFTSANFTFGPTAGQGTTVAAGTATTDVQAETITQTWNNAAVTFTGALWSFTNTNSINTLISKMWDVKVGGNSFVVLSNPSKPVFSLGGAVAGGGGGVYSTCNIQLDTYGGGIWQTSDYVFGWGNSTSSIGTKDSGISRISAALLGIGNATQGSFAGSLKLTDIFTNNAVALVRTNTALTDQAGAQVGTLTNAPTAGNPTKWIAIDDNGTTRKIPTWT